MALNLKRLKKLWLIKRKGEAMLKKLLATFLSGSMLVQGVCFPAFAQTIEPTEDIKEEQTIEMYRLYNSTSGEHFYTRDLNEKDTLVRLGWKYEGIGWYAPKFSQTPVYRLYNKNVGDHHYTTDKNEKDTLVKLGWNDEGISWYSDDSKTIPLYRQYNPNAKAGSHNYTTSKEESDSLCSIGWKAEGIGWYALKEGQPISYEEIYRPILDEAKKIVNSQGKIQYFEYREDLFGIVDALRSYGSSMDDFGYAIQDVSGDDIPELAIIHTQYGEKILSLYTLVNNEPSNIFYGWVRSRYYYAGGSSFINEGSSGALNNAIGLFSLSKDGRTITYNEFYYTEPSSSGQSVNTYFNTTGSYSGPSEYIGGEEVYRQNYQRIYALRQNLNPIPLANWN